MNLPALSTYYVDKQAEIRAKVKEAEQTLEQMRKDATKALDFVADNGAEDLLTELRSLIEAINTKNAVLEAGYHGPITEETAHKFAENISSEAEFEPKQRSGSKPNKELKRLFKKLSHLLHPDKSKLPDCTELMAKTLAMYRDHDIEGLRQLYKDITSKTVVTSDKLVRDAIAAYERRLHLLQHEIDAVCDSPGYVFYNVWQNSPDDDTAISAIKNILITTIKSLRNTHFPEHKTFTFSTSSSGYFTGFDFFR